MWHYLNNLLICQFLVSYNKSNHNYTCITTLKRAWTEIICKKFVNLTNYLFVETTFTSWDYSLFTDRQLWSFSGYDFRQHSLKLKNRNPILPGHWPVVNGTDTWSLHGKFQFNVKLKWSSMNTVWIIWYERYFEQIVCCIWISKRDRGLSILFDIIYGIYSLSE